MNKDSDIVLKVSNLEKHFQKKNLRGRVLQTVKAVDGISFEIRRGESFGLVGESGCGKSTTAMMISGLSDPSAGTICYNGKDVTKVKKGPLAQERRQIQMVFQDPTASIDPRMKVRSTLEEAYRIRKQDCTRERIVELLETVSLDETYIDRYPHELSGGQKQRIGIARALSMDPKLIILDEPTSALDVNIQAQIINLLEKIKIEKNLSYLLITHDLSVVKTVCDRVAVMYLGRIMEQGTVGDVFNHSLHPYTKALFSNIPSLDAEKREKILLNGDVPSPRNIPSGCRFHPRCPMACEKCAREEPSDTELGNGHIVCCHFIDGKTDQ